MHPGFVMSQQAHPYRSPLIHARVVDQKAAGVAAGGCSNSKRGEMVIGYRRGGNNRASQSGARRTARSRNHRPYPIRTAAIGGTNTHRCGVQLRRRDGFVRVASGFAFIGFIDLEV